LIAIGVGLNLMFVPIVFGFRAYIVPFMRGDDRAGRGEAEGGQAAEGVEEHVRDGWKEMTAPETRKDFLEEIELYRGSYAKLVKQPGRGTDLVHLFGIPSLMIGLSGGRMLIGMGLMKLGVFSAACSKRTYLTMMLVGYGVGLPLLALDVAIQVSHRFFLGRRFEAHLEGWDFLTLLGSLPVVFGHIGR